MTIHHGINESDEASNRSFKFDAIGVDIVLQSSILNLFRNSTAPLSAVISAMQDSILLYQEITPDLILKWHLKVLFLSMALPAQSEST